MSETMIWIAGAESLLDLHAVGRDAAENHVDAASLLAIVRKLEQGERCAGTCQERPFHISGRRNLLDFDCATCGKVRARLVRLRAGEFQVDADRAVLDIGIDVHNLGGVGTILEGNRGELVDVNVASLGFGNVNARHQA
jgi:hypothetical protein